LTQEEVATRMGKSRPVITNALRLLTLPEELLTLVRDGALPSGSARALLGIPDRGAMVAAAREVVASGLSTRETEKLAKRYARGERQGTSRHDNDLTAHPHGAAGIDSVNYMEEFEHKLGESLGRRVRIVRGRGNNGRFELEYYGEDDFERLYNGLISIDHTVCIVSLREETL
jgi:ParB family chromosome partitioning protein